MTLPVVLRSVHAAAAIVFVATIVVQVFLAGSAIANLGGSGDFGTHIEFGYTWVGLATIVLLITAIAARRPRADIAVAVGLLALYVVQTLLPAARSSTPAIAALHPVNALLLFGIGAWYARRAWVAARTAAESRVRARSTAEAR